MAWTDYHLHWKRFGRLKAYIGKSLASQTLIRFTHAWTRYVADHKRMRRTVARCLLSKRGDELKSAFNRWHAYSASQPAVGAAYDAGRRLPPPPPPRDFGPPATPPPDLGGHLWSSPRGPSFASTPATARDATYFAEHVSVSQDTMDYESPGKSPLYSSPGGL